MLEMVNFTSYCLNRVTLHLSQNLAQVLVHSFSHHHSILCNVYLVENNDCIDII